MPALPALGAGHWRAGEHGRAGWHTVGTVAPRQVCFSSPPMGIAGGCGEDGQEDASLLSQQGEGKGIPVSFGLCRVSQRGGDKHPGGARGSGLGTAPCAAVGLHVRLPPASLSPRHGTGRGPACGAAWVELCRAQPHWQRYVGSGGIRAACPPRAPLGSAVGSGSWQEAAPWGRKPGYFGGCGGGAVGWHCPCRVTPPGPAPPRSRDGAPGPGLCRLAALSCRVPSGQGPHGGEEMLPA